MYQTDDAEAHRKRAQACMKMAAELTDPAHKMLVLDMATAWLRLADMAEKNRAPDLVYVTPGIPAPELPDPPQTC
jgi:hypothetical protein